MVEVLKKLIDQDKGTIASLKTLRTMVNNNRTAEEYLDKIINDFEKDINELEQKHLMQKAPEEEWVQKAKQILSWCNPRYRWAAMDSNGFWHIYMSKPTANKKLCIWEQDADEGYLCVDNSFVFDIPSAPSWIKSLIERSEDNAF